MKSRHRLMALAPLFSLACLSHGQTLLLDLSDATGVTTVVDGIYWNTLVGNSAGSIADLITTENLSSGISVSVTDSFDGNRSWGTTGTIADDLGLLAVDSATGDGFSFRTLGIDPGELTFSGLDTNLTYKLTIFGESHDNAALAGPSDFTATGLNVTTGTLDTHFNNTEVLVLDGIMPDAEGSISLLAIVSPTADGGTTYSMINALSIEVAVAVVPEPSVFGFLVGVALVPVAMLRRRRKQS